MCDEAASKTPASSGPDDDVSLLRDCFVRSFGVSPEAIVRAPGRVNLIGEHIDYNGYSVLPIAIDQSIFVAVGRNPDDKIKIVNHDTKFEPFTCDIHELGNISSPPAWHDYVLCGLYGVQEHLQVPVSCGINLAVLGRVPKAAGLSSSSALVCSAALAAVAMFSNPKKDEVSSGKNKGNEDKSLKDVSSNRSDEPSLNGVSFKELARVCAVSEKYVGTQGGGMDQAASFLSKRGCAQHISFNPLRCEDVVLPPGASFVVANSMVAANKAATNDFNCRVMECKIACYILAAKNGLVWEKVANMADLQHQLGNKSFAHMISLVENNLHPQPYTLDEVAECLNISAEEVVAKILSENTKNLTSFCLQPRALHVFTEAKRVQDFKCICDLWRDGCADQTLGESCSCSPTVSKLVNMSSLLSPFIC
ncbi:hypothetical protein HAZT_HAZT001277 [Hyalella azteca]|uniref:Galactokinase N-terminal domain-containing protein n=1 Tax=Hyalella azteca TaxID=294128 RepID=A0A6A0GYT7_HYAAZ|nr:hypothetical protein HAZT_HAZT001277 [Hyalella azteca]